LNFATNGDSAGMEINESKKPMKTLERVKRSDSNFSFDLCQQFQLLTPSAYFCVGRIVGRFVRRSIWLACHSKLVLPLWKSVKD
jgi:hypothetical protein